MDIPCIPIVHTCFYIIFIITICILYRKYVKESLINTLLNYAIDNLSKEEERHAISAPISRASSPVPREVYRKITPIHRNQLKPVLYEY